MIKSRSSRIRLLTCVVALGGVASVPTVVKAGPVGIPFPFFTPIAECGKVGVVGSWLPDVDECKVWFSSSGSPFLVAGIDAFEVGDEVFVEGLICNTCLTTCFAGAILNATVTEGCSSAASKEGVPTIRRLDNELELFNQTEGQDFLLTDVQFGIEGDSIVITQAGVDYEQPVTYETNAREVAAESVIIDGTQMNDAAADNKLLRSDADEENANQSQDDFSKDSTELETVSQLEASVPTGELPASKGGFGFDCSTCVESFCGGTMHCTLVDCDVFCNYACTWVICDPGIIEPPVGP